MNRSHLAPPDSLTSEEEGAMRAIIFRDFASRRDVGNIFGFLLCGSETSEQGRAEYHCVERPRSGNELAARRHNCPLPSARQEGPGRFASLLKQADGSTVEIRVGRGDWEALSVARLRMCF